MADVDEPDLLSRNKGLADILALIANYYSMSGDAYRAKAFNNASIKIAQHPNVILSGGQARRELTGIGDSIQSTIDEYIATGTVQRLKELEKDFSDRKDIIDYFRSFYGIGPVTAVKFYNQGYRTLEDLWSKAALTEAQKIGIMWREHLDLRIPRDEMDFINSKIGEILDPYGIKWTIAGSYRREEPSSGDIDLLIESRSDLNMEGAVSLLQPILPATLAQGPAMYRGIVRLSDDYPGHRIDIRLIDPGSYPAALMYFTGSQRFNILMRSRAIALGYLLNEYGLYRNNIPETVKSEEDIFRFLNVKYMAPVERTKTIDELPLL